VGFAPGGRQLDQQICFRPKMTVRFRASWRSNESISPPPSIVGGGPDHFISLVTISVTGTVGLEESNKGAGFVIGLPPA